MTERTVACDDFEASVAELALGVLGAAEADRLQDHAAACARCRAELDVLTGVADRLTELAPPAVPPPGFETRALSTFRPAEEAASSRRRARQVLAAAVVAVLVGLGVAALSGLGDDEPDVRVAQLSDAEGVSHGAVVVADDGGRTILSVTLADVAPGRYDCAVRTADGGTVEVASWPVRRRGSDSWTLELRGAAVDGEAVVITDADGRTIATAALR